MRECNGRHNETRRLWDKKKLIEERILKNIADYSDVCVEPNSGKETVDITIPSRYKTVTTIDTMLRGDIVDIVHILGYETIMALNIENSVATENNIKLKPIKSLELTINDDSLGIIINRCIG